jgi:xanthine dehydrogenase accessory factor
MVTLVAARGSAPQELGAKALFDAGGLVEGTVGGGRLEAHALRRARAALESSAGPACELEVVNLQRDLGMTCGGEVTLLFERFGVAPWRVAVFGAGHVAQALTRLLLTLECRLQVLDTRREWVERLPAAPSLDARVCDDLAGAVGALEDGTFVVVMTQGHATDLPVLRAAFDWGRFGYLGVMGSAVKAARVRRELEASGVSAERLAQLRCPIGLALGRSTPAEIAVSVTAELLSARDALTSEATRAPRPG